MDIYLKNFFQCYGSPVFKEETDMLLIRESETDSWMRRIGCGSLQRQSAAKMKRKGERE